jgi:hypothetical protein
MSLLNRLGSSLAASTPFLKGNNLSPYHNYNAVRDVTDEESSKDNNRCPAFVISVICVEQISFIAMKQDKENERKELVEQRSLVVESIHVGLCMEYEAYIGQGNESYQRYEVP